MILYLTSQQHTNLLDFLTEQTDALPIKKMTGNFMLKQFVIYDMRNFSHCTELVLDRDAFGDDDIHFAEAIEEFLTMYNARITVICEGLQESAPLCHDLLEAGVGNIVTAEEIGAIQNEIRQSLSGQGMTRYKPKERTKPQEKEKLYQFATEGVRITMVSSQSRIGTTTMALGLTAWLALHVTLEREYVENEIIEDSGTYGGIHFVPIDNIDLCANKGNTYYGNKIALLKPISDEVYYEYMEDTFVGNKVYITKVMYLSSVETWKYLSQLTVSLREHKEKLCQYLKGLENLLPEEDYTSSIKFIEEL